MNAIANVAKVVGFNGTNDAVSHSARDAQNAFLSELPGVAFAFITLVYVVSSLIALA
jgi:hypothetical protein